MAATAWLGGWLVGNLAGSGVLSLSGYGNTASAQRPIWLTAATALSLWVPQIAALVVVSRRFATGRPAQDYAIRFRPIDLVGLPVGILSQLVLLRLVYWPLESIWPDVFSNEELERNARDLYDRAAGIGVVVLILVIVVGAPLVEETVYRGLLQGAASRRMNDWVAMVGVAAFFALIHFRAVEYPGLFAFALVLGACVVATDRIGMSILAHLAFNATALALIA